jgi:hypothetical protein
LEIGDWRLEINNWWRTLGSLAGLGAVFYAGLTLVLYLLQERLIYFPTYTWEATPAEIGLPFEEVWLETADGVKLSGWFVPAPQPRGTVLFFHGNAGNISHRLGSLELFHRLGLNTFILDYRGYGRSEGRPSEAGTYLDAGAAWRYLVETRGVPPAEIIIFGESLGGAVAAWTAETYTPGGLILLASFTSIPDMGAQAYPFLPVRLLSRLQYNTLERMPHLNCPVLIIHSPQDEIVPFRHAQRLFEAAQQPKQFLEIRGDHNGGPLLSAQVYERGLAEFITKSSQ